MKHYVKQLKHGTGEQRMTRYFDADSLREYWLTNGKNERVYNTNDFLDSIDYQPSADVQLVVHAHWDCIENVHSYEGTFDGYECSHCHKMFLDDMCENNGSDYVDAKKDFKYCPFCGAKMDEK